MNVRLLAAAAALTAASLAQATAITTTSGLTTTITENFDGGSSFSTGWNDDDGSSDDYLWLSWQPGYPVISTYTFHVPTALSSLDLSFWYASRGGIDSPARFSLMAGTSHSLPATFIGRNPTPFNLGNPGPDNSFSSDSLFTMPTLTGLAAGDYTLAFAIPGDRATYLKIDDLVITATAVPEPGAYAMMLGGLGALGFMGRRRRAVSGQSRP